MARLAFVWRCLKGQPLVFRVCHSFFPVSWIEEMNSSNLPPADKG